MNILCFRSFSSSEWIFVSIQFGWWSTHYATVSQSVTLDLEEWNRNETGKIGVVDLEGRKQTTFIFHSNPSTVYKKWLNTKLLLKNVKSYGSALTWMNIKLAFKSNWKCQLKRQRHLVPKLQKRFFTSGSFRQIFQNGIQNILENPRVLNLRIVSQLRHFVRVRMGP